MQIKVQRWGNRLGLFIPESFAREASIGEGSMVDLSTAEDRLVLQPKRAKKYKLQELLAQVTPENLHGESPSGEP